MGFGQFWHFFSFKSLSNNSQIIKAAEVFFKSFLIFLKLSIISAEATISKFLPSIKIKLEYENNSRLPANFAVGLRIPLAMARILPLLPVKIVRILSASKKSRP